MAGANRARFQASIWFGTDVGFLDDYDPALEFELLRRAGLSFDASSPRSPRRSRSDCRVEANVGACRSVIADLVVLDDDPVEDPKAWTRVRYTFRDGEAIFDANAEAGASER